MTDHSRNPAEILAETIVVDGVAVEIWHHAAYTAGDRRGWRLVRSDTGASTFDSTPISSGSPAKQRQKMAERFVRYYPWADA